MHKNVVEKVFERETLQLPHMLRASAPRDPGHHGVNAFNLSECISDVVNGHNKNAGGLKLKGRKRPQKDESNSPHDMIQLSGITNVRFPAIDRNPRRGIGFLRIMTPLAPNGVPRPTSALPGVIHFEVWRPEFLLRLKTVLECRSRPK